MTVGEYIEALKESIEELQEYNPSDEMTIAIDENGDEYYAIGCRELLN